MEVVSGDNWTTADINRAKLQSNHHHQQTNNQFFYRPNQQCQSTEGIKFCTHLLLYGIHLWADLDCDRRMGGSRPNQTQRRRIAAISAANRQSGGEDGCYYEKFWNFIAWAEPDPKKQHFSRFQDTFDYYVHDIQETVLPQTSGSGTDGKPRL